MVVGERALAVIYATVEADHGGVLDCRPPVLLLVKIATPQSCFPHHRTPADKATPYRLAPNKAMQLTPSAPSRCVFQMLQRASAQLIAVVSRLPIKHPLDEVLLLRYIYWTP